MTAQDKPARVYRSYGKHKGDFPHASKCPRGFGNAMQGLLEAAIPEGTGHKVLYNVYTAEGEVGIVAFRKEDDRTYHGYPVAGDEVPPEIIEEFLRLDRITAQDRRHLLRGR